MTSLRALLVRSAPVGLALVIAAMLLPRPAAAATYELADRVTSTYEVEPKLGLVRVTVEVQLTLVPASSTPCGQPIFENDGGQVGVHCAGAGEGFDWYEIAIEKDATGVAATSDGGAISTSDLRLADPDYTYLRLSFREPANGGSRRLEVGYELRSAPIGSDDPLRVGAAYVYSCVRGNGWDRGDVRVRFPESFSWTVASGERMAEEPERGMHVLDWSGSSPYEERTCLQLVNSAALVSTSVTVAGRSYQIMAWPEDASWGGRVAAEIQHDVPALESLIGRAPSSSAAVRIVEYSMAQLGEYDGFYEDATKALYLSESLHNVTVAHELSHMWFNNNTVADPWLYEGLASYMEAVAGGEDAVVCNRAPRYPGSGNPDLLDWQYIRGEATPVDLQIVDYQYAASCYAVWYAAQKLGETRLRDVLDAADRHEIAYVGRTLPETVGGGPLTWQQWLDLVDERSPSSGDLDEVQTVLANLGISAGADTMRARSEARARYHDLLARSNGWLMPAAIRLPMAAWNFAAAEQGLARATTILEKIEEMRRLVPAAYAEDLALRSAFESAADEADLAAVLDAVDARLAVVRHVSDAIEAAQGARDPLSAVGLAGVHLEPAIDRATASLKSGDLDGANQAADEILGRVNDARREAAIRLAPFVGATLAAVAFGFALFLRRTLRRRRALVAAIAAGLEPDPAKRAADELAEWGLVVPPPPEPQPVSAPRPGPAPAAPAAWDAAPPPASWPGVPVWSAWPPAPGPWPWPAAGPWQPAAAPPRQPDEVTRDAEEWRAWGLAPGDRGEER